MENVNVNNQFQTPKKSLKDSTISIPASPYLKRLGYGTGVFVYKFNRSPKINSLKSPWAVKIVKNETHGKLLGKRLRVEANLLRKMDNPYIVGFRQFSKNIEGKECLAMEECTSCLGNLIETQLEKYEHAFSPDKILKVGLDISKALDYLHVKVLLLHGDIKSHNILIKGDFDICKLCDFGVSLRLKSNGELDSDKAGDILEFDGTVCWSAPEVLKDPPYITKNADIFSYGLVLWEMMALDVPHSNIETDEDEMDSEEFELLREAAFGTRPAVPVHMLGENTDSYNHTLEIFYCCTQENPEDRPQANQLIVTITEMLDEIIITDVNI